MWHLVSRFLQMTVIVAFLSVALFGLLSAMPGNPVDLLITSNPRVKPEDVIRLKKLRGLDKPWYVQYVRWIWGYNDPHRPPMVADIPEVETGAARDVGNYLQHPDYRFQAAELTALIEKERPDVAASLEKNNAVKAGKESQLADIMLEQIAGIDGSYYDQLLQQLKNRAAKELKVEPLFGAQLEGTTLKPAGGAGGDRIWFVVKEPHGLETVGSLAVKGVVQKVSIQPIPSQIVDDPKVFSVNLAPFISAQTPESGKLKYQLLNKSPGEIDENGVYRHEFKNPGQSAIQFSVADSSGNKSYGAFSVEHGPLPDKTKFNRGFIFFFVGDTDALGFSSTYKRPVWELLAGTTTHCGDGNLDPGESCDDGNRLDNDGCSANCYKEDHSIWQKTQTKVAGMMVSTGRIGNTLQLMFPAILLSLLIALPLGVFSAYKQYSWLDYIVNFLAFIGISLPVFWFGIMVMYILAEKFQMFPAGGIQTPGIHEQGLYATVADRLSHSFLPTIVLSIAYIGRWLRYMRASMLEVLPADYIRTARAKGLSEKAVILKHALRNALIPVVTVLALSIPALFGGAVLTETVFSWPGIGRLEYDAVMNSDYYVAIVVFLISAVLVMVGNLLADALYVVVDPRIRHG